MVNRSLQPTPSLPSPSSDVLIHAVRTGTFEAFVDLLRQHPQFDVNQHALHTGATALHEGCRRDDDVRFSALILSLPGIDVNAQNCDGETPLFTACECLRVAEVFWLLERSETDVNQANYEGEIPLMMVSNPSATRMLLRRKDINVLAVDKNLRSAWWWLCKGRRDFHKARWLMQHEGMQGGVNHVDRSGEHALQAACSDEQGDDEIYFAQFILRQVPAEHRRSTWKKRTTFTPSGGKRGRRMLWTRRYRRQGGSTSPTGQK